MKYLYCFYFLHSGDSVPFYIGITRGSLRKRLLSHIVEGSQYSPYQQQKSSRKRQKIHSLNCNVFIEKICQHVCTKEEALIKEMYLIQKYLSEGYTLTNSVIWIRKVLDIFSEVEKLSPPDIVTPERIKPNKKEKIYPDVSSLNVYQTKKIKTPPTGFYRHLKKIYPDRVYKINTYKSIYRVTRIR